MPPNDGNVKLFRCLYGLKNAYFFRWPLSEFLKLVVSNFRNTDLIEKLLR